MHEGRAPVARAATKAPAELCPVQLSLEAVGTMVHDFATEQMCEVPVTVRSQPTLFKLKTKPEVGPWGLMAAV